jgi:hypothetical protein
MLNTLKTLPKLLLILYSGLFEVSHIGNPQRNQYQKQEIRISGNLPVSLFRQHCNILQYCPEKKKTRKKVLNYGIVRMK